MRITTNREAPSSTFFLALLSHTAYYVILLSPLTFTKPSVHFYTYLTSGHTHELVVKLYPYS